jgi:hypothetical protein
MEQANENNASEIGYEMLMSIFQFWFEFIVLHLGYSPSPKPKLLIL